MLINKRIPPATVEFRSGGACSLNKKIGSQIAKQAIGVGLHLEKSIADSDDLLDDLEHGHQALDALLEIEKSQKQLVSDLQNTARSLRGEEVVAAPSDPVEQSHTIVALAEAIKLADPDLDLSEISDLADRCEDIAAELSKDLEITSQRRERLDKILRRSTGVACAQTASPALEIFKRFEWPDHWEHEDCPDADDPEQHLRRLARKHIKLDANGLAKSKRERKRKAENELRQQAAKIWESAR